MFDIILLVLIVIAFVVAVAFAMRNVGNDPNPEQREDDDRDWG